MLNISLKKKFIIILILSLFFINFKQLLSLTMFLKISLNIESLIYQIIISFREKENRDLLFHSSVNSKSFSQIKFEIRNLLFKKKKNARQRKERKWRKIDTKRI